MSELIDIVNECNEFLIKYGVLNFCIFGYLIHENIQGNSIADACRKGWNEYMENVVRTSYQVRVSTTAALYTLLN